MAQRRMFSKSITNSSQFLMMPQSSQSLYFHLGMNADDDGFCEHFTVMRMTESKPDDLKVLQAKEFITIFDDKVLVITDWKENNYLRNDRYTPSKYLEIYKKELKALSTAGIPKVDQMATQVRLGKDRIGKTNTSTIVEGEDPRNKEVQEIWEYGQGLRFTSTRERLNRFAIHRLIKAHGSDLVKKYAKFSQAIRQHQYAPQINNWMDLEEKLPKLRDFAERQKQKAPKIINLDTV